MEPPAKNLFAKNLERIIATDGRDEADIGLALGLGATAGVAASNLRKYLRGERWPGEKMFDAMAEELRVARAEFFREAARKKA